MNPKPGMEFLASLDPAAAENLEKFQKISPELINSFVNRLYGETYQRDRLSRRERFLVTIAGLMASAHVDAQLAMQVRLALKNGLTREELMEAALQISIFSGYGNAINAAAIIDGVADQVEIESES